MTILEKNINALKSGVNEVLAKKLENFLQNPIFNRFSMDENLNIYDKDNNVFMFENLEQELEIFKNAILEKSLRYPFICIYGIANALLIKNLSPNYKHIFVFEKEIELFILALSVVDLSEELKNYKIILFDLEQVDIVVYLAMFFDFQKILEYLSLYELFISNFYYKNFYGEKIISTNELCIKTAEVAIRNADIHCTLPLLVHSHFLTNVPVMLEHIPFQRLLSERKNKFHTAIVVSAGPSLAKQLPLLKEYQNKAVIFCADGALPMLEKEDITPDYITNLDTKNSTLKFFNHNKKLDKSIIALECATNPDIIKYFNDFENSMLVIRNKALYGRFNLNDFGYIDTGTHVSHFSYTLAIALGFKNIIMIGQDLAFDEKGNSHSKGFSFGENFDSEHQYTKLKVLAYGGKGEVLTHYTWNDYRVKLEYLFACNANINFYNATEGGARINFTTELPFKECIDKFLKEDKPKFELPKSLTKNRSDKLLLKFKDKLKQDKILATTFLNDARVLKDALDNILSKNIALPLEFLEQVYQNIENFNISIDNDEFLQDEVLRGNFAYRGKFISDVLRLNIKEQSEFLTAYINAYNEWMSHFIDKLEQKYQNLEKISK